MSLKNCILVVDDDEIKRYSIVKTLNRFGYETQEAKTGNEALQILAEAPLMVILDVQLPDIHGIEVCRRIKQQERFNGVPVLHVSATFVDTDSRVQGLEGGADGYLVEPLEPVELVATVRALLRTRKAEAVAREAELKYRKLAETLAVTNEALKQSNFDLEQFSYVASHDLKEPLRTIKGFAQLLERNLKTVDAQTHEHLGYIIRGTTRMERLIENLLSYAQVGRQRAKWGDVDLNKLIQLVIQNFAEQLSQRKIEIHVGDMPTVRGDEMLLEELFQNLIGNAIKFGPPVQARVEIKAGSTGDFWEFEVSDNGIGIAEQYREQIFRPFQRLHSQDDYPGSGIGLATCRKVVEFHGGKIWLESNPGVGTQFFFTLSKTPSVP